MKELYGLIGKKLVHSFSARWFNDKFGGEHIPAEYSLFPIPEIKYISRLLEENPNLCGLNVTIPYKESVIPFLDELDEEASAIGAVNVIKIFYDDEGRKRLKGFNSDIYGFSSSITPMLNGNERNALVLGTGGASKCVCYSLEMRGIKVRFVSRSHSDDERILTYDELTPDIIREADIIVNTTPSGMYPNVESCPDLQYDEILSGTICFDLIYNPEETKFLKLCRQNGAIVKNGLEMLYLQAERSWEIWSN